MGDSAFKKTPEFTDWLRDRAGAGRELPLAHVAALATIAAGPIPTTAATYDRLAELLAGHDAGHHAMPPKLPRIEDLVAEFDARIATLLATEHYASLQKWVRDVSEATKPTEPTERHTHTKCMLCDAPIVPVATYTMNYDDRIRSR
jgi:hypothetical protein